MTKIVAGPAQGLEGDQMVKKREKLSPFCLLKKLYQGQGSSLSPLTDAEPDAQALSPFCRLSPW